MYQTFVFLIKHRCVALLYFQFNIGQSVQVSDTTKLKRAIEPGSKKWFNNFSSFSIL